MGAADLIRFDSFASEAATLTRFDGGIVNLLSGVGTTSDRSSYNHVRSPQLLNQQECDDLYAYWIPKKVVNLVASRATQQGWTLTQAKVGNKQLIADIDQYCKERQLHRAIKELSILERLYGGSVGVLLVDDGQDADQPLRWEAVKSIEGIVPLDRYQVFPSIQASAGLHDFRRAEYFEILSYSLQAEQERLGQVFRIHRSRLLLFWGQYAPYRVRQNNLGWGYSALQSIVDPWKNLEAGLAGLGGTLQDFDLYWRKVSNLAQKVANKGAEAIQNLALADALTRATTKSVLLSDDEEAGFISRNYGGVADIIDRFKSQIVGASTIPHTLLFGESPSGLGATGESEERDFATTCEEYIEDHLLEPTRYLMRVVQSAKDSPTKGKELEGWDVKYPSVYTLSELQRADLILKYAQADNTYVAMGARTAEETAIDRFSGDEFGTDWTLGYKRKVVDPATIQQEQAAAALPAEAAQPAEGEAAQEELPPLDENAVLDSLRADGNPEPIKRLYRAHGLTFGVTHDAGDFRHGRPLQSGYGHLRGSYGMARDGKAIDCYLCREPVDGAKLYKVRQLNQQGIYDEDKLMVGYGSIESARDAFRAQMPTWAFGGIEELRPDELDLFKVGEETY